MRKRGLDFVATRSRYGSHVKANAQTLGPLVQEHCLDDAATFALDASGMLAHAEGFGDELLRAWKTLEAPRCEEPPPANIEALVLAGVGGSATGGDYLLALARSTSPIPIQVVRSFELPDYANASTLVVCCSHSGNTEETLACFVDGLRRGARMFTVTSGGELAKHADASQVRGFSFESSCAPRAALPWALAALMRIGNWAGVTAISDVDVAMAANAHRRVVQGALRSQIPFAANPAKQLAERMNGKIPLIVAAAHLEPVAERFKNQLSENGKSLAMAATLPELGHNVIVALDRYAQVDAPVILVTLESPAYHPRVAQRFDAVTGMLAGHGQPGIRVCVGGQGLLADIVEATAWADLTSCYVALQSGIDPTPIQPIDELKVALGHRA